MMNVDYSKLEDIINKLEELAKNADEIGNSLTSDVLEVSDTDLVNITRKFYNAAIKLRTAKEELIRMQKELKNKESTILGT